MTLKLADMLDKVAQAEDREALTSVLHAISNTWGVKHVAFQWLSPDHQNLSIATYPADWQRRYLDENYARFDPVVVASCESLGQLDWQSLNWSSPSADTYRQDAQSHGIGPQGTSVPIRGPFRQFALLNVSDTRPSADWQDFVDTRIYEFHAVALALLQQSLKTQHSAERPSFRALSPREVDALTWLAAGYSRPQISNILCISEHTLRAYIEGARSKLGAANTTQAVALALSDDLINLASGRCLTARNWNSRSLHDSRTLPAAE